MKFLSNILVICHCLTIIYTMFAGGAFAVCLFVFAVGLPVSSRICDSIFLGTAHIHYLVD